MGIEVRDLYKAFGSNRVFSGLNVSFADGQRTCIMGESGCGKTTLLRIMMGLEKSDRGQITGLDKNKISAVFQEDRLLERFSALANIRAVCPKTPTEEILAHFDEVGLKDSLNKKVSELSGGMKRRAAIVRAVLLPKEVLILDEPFKGLDEYNRDLTGSYIKRHTDGVTTIMVTHIPEEVELMGAKLLPIEKAI